MMMKRPVNDVDTKAATWAARGNVGTLSADEQAELDAWLREDPRHMGAYLKMQAALLRVERLGPAALRLQARQPGLRLFESRWRWALAGGFATAFAAIAIFTLAFNANSYNAEFRTVIGQTKVASMPDGSRLTLNTNSDVAVHYSLFSRSITLKQGEVLFDVAKNKARPFVVKVAETQVRAVGTSFMVSDLADRPLSVMVREGAIEIRNPHLAQAVTVRAGSRAEAQAEGAVLVAPLSSAQIAGELGWLEGRLFFRRQSLASAAKEFERYSAVRILIDDPAVARKTVTGVFVATDPVAFANAVSMILDLKVESTGKTLQLSRKTN